MRRNCLYIYLVLVLGLFPYVIFAQESRLVFDTVHSPALERITYWGTQRIEALSSIYLRVMMLHENNAIQSCIYYMAEARQILLGREGT
jgi:hypothetical protein